ncbi:hypothetical protein CHS0354_040425 [Potamilus streckersoni]|uniref:HECT domain-containing protein n=1 Tax=Potamilus streckersoni TaxID=2493646 RepID=A0AAE0W4J6_9BIVA|nr:hypothetical protein CHS0354_040425 [Potamilus streckersoni]
MIVSGCCTKRSNAHRRCVCGRCICESSCHQSFCQATRNRFTAVFQALRRCFYSTVIFIQYCHLWRRKGNKNEENNILSTAGAYSQSADVMEADVISGVVNQQTDDVGVDVIDEAVNQTVDDIDSQQAIFDGDAGSSSTDAEGHVQYKTEAISDTNLDGIDVEIDDQDTNLDFIDEEIEDQAGTEDQSADGMEDDVISRAVDQKEDGDGEEFITDVVFETLDDTNLDFIDEEIEDQAGTEDQSADGMEDDVISRAVDQKEDGDGEEFITDVVFETLDALEILHSLLEHPPQMLWVRRSQIVTDVLGLFEDSSTGTQLISTRFIDEDGVDGGGVTREMLTVFWNEVKERYFHGNEVFVPHLRPERLSEKKDFVTLGRIFSLSTATLRSIPIQICRSTLMVIIYDTCDINPDTLLEDFLLFLDNEDRELLKSSLNCVSFDNMGEEEKEKLQEFLMKFGMGIVLKPATLKQYMINLAQNELCIKPKFFCENMRKGIPQRHLEDFWMQITLDHLDHLYRDFRVTAENIWPKIQCETWPLHNLDEIRVYGYLRDLIQDLEEETLLSFVQFVTADRKIPSSFITVGFSDTQGIARCPVASTCAYRLDIPVSYSNYEEFKTEFMMVLNSPEAKTFSKD